MDVAKFFVLTRPGLPPRVVQWLAFLYRGLHWTGLRTDGAVQRTGCALGRTVGVMDKVGNALQRKCGVLDVTGGAI